MSLSLPTITMARDFSAEISQKEMQISEIQAQKSNAEQAVAKLTEEISSLKERSEALISQNQQLEKEQLKLSKKVDELNQRIVKRTEKIKMQARSIQTSGSTVNLFNALFASDSLTDAINRIKAVAKIMSANNTLVEEQKADKAEVIQKQKQTTAKMEKVVKNQAAIQKDIDVLAVKTEELEVANLELQASLATAVGERESILKEKKTAEERAERVRQEQIAKAKKEAALRLESERQAARDRADREEAERQQALAREQAERQQAEAERQQAEKEQAEKERAEEARKQAEENQAASTPAPSTPTASTPAPATPTPTPTPTPTKPAPTPSDGGRYGSRNTYVPGQCTWYVKSVFGSRVGDYWGNGGSWGYAAMADGYTVSSTPAIGTVAVFPPGVGGAGGYGHVAVVIGVSGGNVVIREMNYGGPYLLNTRTLSASGLSFIYV
jgi:peptidoglycan hydrolase CwlO-like protein/surface antigen